MSSILKVHILFTSILWAQHSRLINDLHFTLIGMLVCLMPTIHNTSWSWLLYSELECNEEDQTCLMYMLDKRIAWNAYTLNRSNDIMAHAWSCAVCSNRTWKQTNQLMLNTSGCIDNITNAVWEHTWQGWTTVIFARRLFTLLRVGVSAPHGRLGTHQ